MPRHRRAPVTLADVAAAARVSTALVSKVLNGNRSTTRVADGTARRIRAEAERLGYRRNSAAYAYRSGHFGTVAVCNRKDLGVAHHEVLRHAVHALEAAGYLTVSAELDEIRISDPSYTPHLFRELRVDGLLLHFNHLVRDEDVRAVAGFGVPAVWINSYATVDSVIPDDVSAGCLAIDALVAAGRRCLAYIQPIVGTFHLGPHPSRAQRLLGAERSAAVAGVPLRSLAQPKGDSLQEVITAWRNLLVAHHDVDGWIIEEGMGAVHLGHILAETKRRLRHEVDVAVIDPGAQFNGLRDFCLLPLPLESMVHAAVSMLMRKIAESQATEPRQVIPFSPAEW